MSLQRLSKIALQFIQEILQRQKNPKIVVLIVQKATVANALKKIGIQLRLPTRLTPQLRQTLLRGFQRVAPQRARFLRPFSTLHFHQQRLQELDQSRRRGFVLLRQHQAKRDVLERVRHIFGTNVRYNRSLAVTEYPETLEGYEIGQHIARGCNGAVYELRLVQQQQNDANVEDVEEVQPPKMDKFKSFPLALKIMFNLEFDRPEHLLLREMGTELVPLSPLPKGLRGWRMANIKTLPRPHPNLIKMHTAFLDRIPILPGARELYPDALPTIPDFQVPLSINREPRTLFVVMKRYRMTLYEYVNTRRRNYWVGRVLFGQLLEAIVFLHQNRICHRDMKSDNILLDFDHAEDVPHLVLSDFGCALATGTWLQPYQDEYADLGGNLALRAPEVRKARLGPRTWIDYEMADTWAAGTLAYEIFTRRNPFYAVLSGQNYREEDLPPLPTRLIGPIKRLIGDMLHVDPKARPKPEVAANVLAISLFRFGQDLRQFFHKCGLHWHWAMEQSARGTFSTLREKLNAKMRDFTELYATETMLARLINPKVISSAELQLRATFLSRVNTEELRTALDYFLVDGEKGGGNVWDGEDGSFSYGKWSSATNSTSHETAFSSAQCN